LTPFTPQNESTFLQARRLIRVSQTVAGEIAGVSRQAIGALEKEGRPPKVPELLRLAGLYRVRPELLLSGAQIRPQRIPRGTAQFRAASGIRPDPNDLSEIALAEDELETWGRATNLPDLS
jgi:DNA-binding XRE family transcriptional regulator